MDWRNFFRGIFSSVLPKEYWRSWRPSSTVDFTRSALASGLLECAAFLYLLVHGYFRFLAGRAHQLQPLQSANEGTQLYWLVLLTIEYAFRPLSLLAIFLVGDGALRSWAAFITDEIVPSIPIRVVALAQGWLRARRLQKSMGPAIPDLFERSEGMDYHLRIAAQRPKDGWRVSTTVSVSGEFHEIVRMETGLGTRPFVYLLRKLPAGRVMRGMYRYDPPVNSTGSTSMDGS